MLIYVVDRKENIMEKGQNATMFLNIFSFFTKQQNFGQPQIESFCRQQFKCELNIEICFG